MHVRHSPRPRLQRAFIAWLSTARPRFKLPVSIVACTKRHIRCRLLGCTRAIDITLTTELTVCALRDNECWDVLLWLDVQAQKTQGRYFCALCPPENRDSYASRDALWCAELFEPFLTWVNQHAAQASWLDFHATAGGSTWAKFGHDDQETQSPTLVGRIAVRSHGQNTRQK